MDIIELRSKARALEPLVRIGKNGITDNVINEVEKLLKKRKLVKIKLLNNCPDEIRDAAAETITQKTGSILVSKVGLVFTVYRNRK